MVQVLLLEIFDCIDILSKLHTYNEVLTRLLDKKFQSYASSVTSTEEMCEVWFRQTSDGKMKGMVAHLGIQVKDIEIHTC